MELFKCGLTASHDKLIRLLTVNEWNDTLLGKNITNLFAKFLENLHFWLMKPVTKLVQ